MGKAYKRADGCRGPIWKAHRAQKSPAASFMSAKRRQNKLLSNNLRPPALATAPKCRVTDVPPDLHETAIGT
ncbi:hypothetical protein LTS15_007799 [Exophiala xenobiotica]|nr:hypothetical protein LTS15_007799 [Exophiala xenobiotica]